MDLIPVGHRGEDSADVWERVVGGGYQSRDIRDRGHQGKFLRFVEVVTEKECICHTDGFVPGP